MSKAIKLRAFLRHQHVAVETHDVSGGFLRVARRHWGDTMPLEPARYTRGVLVVRCPSPLWRAELFSVLNSIEDELTNELQDHSFQKISPVLV